MEGLAPILEKFRITPASAPTVILFMFISLIVLLLFIGYQFRITRRYKREWLKESWQWFFNYCENFDLSIEEVDFLKNIIKKYSPKDPFRLLASKYTLDDILFKEFESSPEEDKETNLKIIHELRRKLKLTLLTRSLKFNNTRELETGSILNIALLTDKKKTVIYADVIEVTEDYFRAKLEKRTNSNYLKEYLDKEIVINFWLTSYAGFSFNSVLINLKDSIMTFTHTDKFNKFQRRHYFRIDVQLKGKYYPLSSLEKEDFENTNEFSPKSGSILRTTRIINISGGGIAITTTEKLEKSQLIWIKITLSDNEYIQNIIGRIVRGKSVKKSRYKYVVIFEKIKESEREIIIKYIYEKQRRLLNF